MGFFKFNLESFIKTSKAKIIFSILLGFGIATLFRKACKERNCMVFKCPPIKNIKDKIFKEDGKCLTYDIENSKCSNNNIIMNIDYD